jgi:hypothetical protein
LQEEIRKSNIFFVGVIEKQQAKMKACETQISILSDSVKEMSEGGMPRLEETSRIWKVKEKVRGVIQHKLEDIEEKKQRIRGNLAQLKGEEIHNLFICRASTKRRIFKNADRANSA